MKRKIFAWALVLLLSAALLAGCGAKASRTEAAAQLAAGAPAPMPEKAADTAYDAGAAGVSPAVPAGEGDKIIHTAELELETLDFDDAMEALAAAAEACGGYYESSWLSASDGLRSASYTVRIPAEAFRDFLDQAGRSAHLLSRSEYADDVSAVYYDTDGRLRTQQTKLERLRELLARAESMEDIIALESAVSETEEQIDRLTGELNRYDAQVAYASVSVRLREVSRLSSVPEPVQGFGGRLVSALKTGLAGFVTDLQELLIALAYGWEWLVLTGGLLAAAVLFLRRLRRRSRAKKEN